jgi:hypothetical protein
MNSIQRKANKLATTVCLLVVCSSLLTACGGSDDGSDTVAGIGGTGIVTGKITEFGSIYVNGGKFDIDNSRFDVDGDISADQSDLALGMVVKLRVETENGAFTSNALEVVYDNEIEGPLINVMTDPIDPAIKTGTVFGKSITFDQVNTQFEDTSFGEIGAEGSPNPDLIEVSGFRVSTSDIVATYVRFIEDLELLSSEIELRGNIEDYTAGGNTFKIDGTLIDFDPTGVNTEIEVPGGVISNGLYVEVEGVIQTATSVFAEEIELEDEDFDGDVDDISLEGIVSDFDDISKDFSIGSQRVNASMAKLKPAGLTLVDGLNIEVEGAIIGGILIADEVEQE